MNDIRAGWLDFITSISSGYRHLSVGKRLVAVVKAYAASLVARQIGMYRQAIANVLHWTEQT